MSARWQTDRGTEGGSLHLLVRHLAANNSEGVGRGVVVDLDAAEGLRTSANREPSLIGVIVKHHSGPAGADDRFTAREESRGASQSHSPTGCLCHMTSMGVGAYRGRWRQWIQTSSQRPRQSTTPGQGDTQSKGIKWRKVRRTRQGPEKWLS